MHLRCISSAILGLFRLLAFFGSFPTLQREGGIRLLDVRLTIVLGCCVIVTKPLLQTSRTALDAPIHFLLRRPNRCQDRRSLRRSFPENLITCIVTLTPHVTHHVQSSRDSRLSRFTKCLSPSLSHPLSLYVRSFPTLHSCAAQLHSLHSCTVSVVDCALSTVRSNTQSAVVYAQHCTVIPQECTVNAQPPLMYIRPPFCTL